MGQTTGITWTHHTANFWMGCQRVSPGCEHCYAETLVTGRMGFKVWGPASTTERKLAKGVWSDVPKWDRDAARDGVRRRVFVSSLSDVFEDHPMVAPWRARALDLLATCTALDVQLLTKRPENVRAMVPPSWLAPGGWPSHVWLGTTVEDQRRAEERIPHLLRIPARVRFLSMEPLLEAVTLDLRERCFGGGCKGGCLESEEYVSMDSALRCRRCQHPTTTFEPGISWVIVGGESGSKARPFALEWACSVVDQCQAAGVPCFVKQMGDHPTLEGARIRFKAHHGADPSEWGAVLSVQEFPR